MNLGRPLNENACKISTTNRNLTIRPATERPSCFSACTAGPAREWLIQWRPVSDWRQIQARIRKARTSADPSGQLAALYERTRDAMVAFELAQIHEKTGANLEAARWYTAAAERFRRAQWKQKAEEALTRLGAPIPVTTAAGSASESAAEPAPRLEPIITEFSDGQMPEAAGEPNGGEQE